MAQGKNVIQVYRDWRDLFEDLDDLQLGQLMRLFFDYVNDMNPQEPKEIILKPYWKIIKSQLKRDLKKWEATCEKNKRNAKIRWEEKDATACDRIRIMPPDANHADKDKDKDKDKEEKHYRVFKEDFLNSFSLFEDEARRMGVKLEQVELAAYNFDLYMLKQNQLFSDIKHVKNYFKKWLPDHTPTLSQALNSGRGRR